MNGYKSSANFKQIERPTFKTIQEANEWANKFYNNYNALVKALPIEFKAIQDQWNVASGTTVINVGGGGSNGSSGGGKKIDGGITSVSPSGTTIPLSIVMPNTIYAVIKVYCVNSLGDDVHCFFNNLTTTSFKCTPTETATLEWRAIE